MRTSHAPRPCKKAFTLIELLVVISIIAILASLLLPAIGRAKINAQRKVCQTEAVGLVSAISSYYSTYSRLPASTNAVNVAAGLPYSFTFGSCITGSGKPLIGTPNFKGVGSSGFINTGVNYQNNNSEVIAILRDDTYYPEYATNGGMRLGHIYNPQQTQFYQNKTAQAGSIQEGWIGNPGVGPDEILRDPWGQPYIVSLDLQGNNYVVDQYLNEMYQGQMNNHTATNKIQGNAVVWSLGPFTNRFDFTQSQKASINKYIVTSY